MVPLVRIFLFLLLFSSCAKMGYLYDQGMGQISLLNSGRKNEDVLKDVKVPQKFKKKIARINEYKSFFYRFWNRKESPIYSKTTFLKNKAVTYLVITSPHSQIKANEECFPFMGCFPYLGFFERENAEKHAKNKEKENQVTWIRPVYAYSTLGYFDDTILSSFFEYSDYDLSELIFHELFHTIFFIKDEVDLNENLANFFGKEMSIIYFKVSKDDLRRKIGEKEKKDILSMDVVEWIKKINTKYAQEKPKTKEESQKLLKSVLENEFRPFFEKKCEDLAVKHCFPLTRKWNNASLAAFMTYEKKGANLRQLQKKLNLSIKDFFVYIERRYKEYENEGPDRPFSEILFMPLEEK